MQGHAAAVDSTPLRANGGVWHKKLRRAREVPHTSIDTEAAWSKSGYHGWWYGWKWHLAVTVGSIWIPLAAELPVAEQADNALAPRLVEQLPPEVRRYGRGDTRDNDPARRRQGHRRGSSPQRAGGVEVRKGLTSPIRDYSERPCTFPANTA
jgi:hypothetical protein